MKKILLAILILGVAGAGIGYYLYNKPPDSMQSLKAEVTTEASVLLKDFESNEQAADAKYNGKIIEVSGKVKEMSQEDSVITISLDGGSELNAISCQLDKLSKHPKTVFQPGEMLRVRGQCTGFLDMSGVIVQRCVVLQ